MNVLNCLIDCVSLVYIYECMHKEGIYIFWLANTNMHAQSGSSIFQVKVCCLFGVIQVIWKEFPCHGVIMKFIVCPLQTSINYVYVSLWYTCGMGSMVILHCTLGNDVQTLGTPLPCSICGDFIIFRQMQGSFCICTQPMRDDITVTSTLIGWAGTQNDPWDEQIT